jgi:hypothetical protein
LRVWDRSRCRDPAGARLPNWLDWVAIVIGLVMVTPVWWIGLFVIFVSALIVRALIYRRSATVTPAPSAAVAEP